MTNPTDRLDRIYRQACDDAARYTVPGATFQGAFNARDLRGYAADSPEGRLYVSCYVTALPSRIVTDPSGMVLDQKAATDV